MRKKKISQKSLFREYMSHWYVILLCILLMFPAYMILPLTISFFMTKGVAVFWSSLIGIATAGFVATLPLLILNIMLTCRRKYYALAVQFVLFDIIGTVFFVINQIGLNS